MIDRERQHAQAVERLLNDRIIFLGTPIDDQVANTMVAQLLFLLDRDSQPISIYINSPGGSVTAAFAILDSMDYATAPIYTTCVGVASGMALLILAHATKGCRFALPHARFQMTATRIGTGATPTKAEAVRAELLRMEELIVSRLAEDTGQPREKVRADMNSELFLDAYRAKEYGLIDEIVKV